MKMQAARSNIPGEPPTCECYPGYEGDGFDCGSALSRNPEGTELRYRGKLLPRPRPWAQTTMDMILRSTATQ